MIKSLDNTIDFLRTVDIDLEVVSLVGHIVRHDAQTLCIVEDLDLKFHVWRLRVSLVLPRGNA